MKRDADLSRDLLFSFEGNDEWLQMTVGDTHGSSKEDRRKMYHINLMGDEGFLIGVGEVTFRMTSHGHDYLDAIRDEGIWNKTKEAVVASGGAATFEILKSVAQAFVKTKLEKHTGLKL